MDDNRIEIVAGLDIPKTVSTIKDDLKKVTDQLNSDQALKIACGIDVKNINVKEMQQSLNAVAQKADLKLDIKSTLDKEVITRDIDAIKKSLQLSVSSVGSKTDFRNAFKPMLQEFRNAYTAMNTEELEHSFDKIIEFIKKTARESIVLDNTFKELKQSLQDAIAVEGRISIDKPTYGDLKSIYGGATDDVLNQVFGKKNWEHSSSKNRLSHQGFDTVIDTLNKYQGTNIEYNNLAEGIASIYDVISKPVPKGTILDAVPDLQALFDELATGLGLPSGAYDVTNFGQIFSGDEEVLKKLSDALEQVKQETIAVAQAAKEVKYPQIAVGGDTKSTLVNAKETLNQFFNVEGIDGEANRVKRAIEDTEGELQRFYVQVERGDKSVETLTYALNEQGNAYEYLGKTIREADNSTDFRRKDITTQWDIQTQKLQQFITNAEKAGAASTVLSDDIANLKNKLNDKGDTSAMNSFLDDFDIAKAKFQAFNAEVRKDNAISNFNNKIKKLSADMNAYATTNQRAVESTKKMTSGTTFADEWVRLTGLMAKGANLTDTELRNLIADMAVFKKESKSAGLEGASAFEKFANSFKVISTYISANQIINRVISQIREGITELKEIDNILTEISKTSDRTSESLRRLGQASFDVASNYGRTASDYLLGVQEMSRAGFGEVQSEQLAELSLRAQAAGDMTAEMANQYIIATNAAYALAGNEDKLNQVLDSQNYITNHNAVNMENLAQATKIAASQASASGVAIDELTAAVGTMVAVTQQGGDQAGRAFKGILMNIQQVKASAADIGDGGEDITTESLSKYEKATAALGVALKEVRNGTLQLREPMEVLRDLSEAVRKESEGSIKVANLISAVGGKFRGNQLIALLQNWETYEKMLSEFNSDKAIGSAMDEAEKSANNWAGSINKVKNSWAELTSKFADSDNMISILNSINAIIQSLSDSTVTGALRSLSDTFAGIFKAVSLLTEKLGALPTLLTTIATVNSIRGKGKLSPNMPIYALSLLCV